MGLPGGSHRVRKSDAAHGECWRHGVEPREASSGPWPGSCTSPRPEMKLVTAIIQPTCFEAIKQVVTSAYAHGLTVTDVRGAGRQRGHSEVYRGSELGIQLIPKVKLEVAIDDDEVDAMVDAI